MTKTESPLLVTLKRALEYSALRTNLSEGKEEHFCGGCGNYPARDGIIYHAPWCWVPEARAIVENHRELPDPQLCLKVGQLRAEVHAALLRVGAAGGTTKKERAEALTSLHTALKLADEVTSGLRNLCSDAGVPNSEPLARLAHWARCGAPCFSTGGASQLSAQAHGAATVRAIREAEANPCGWHDKPVACYPEGFIFNESRAAVRAALTACGITGNL